MSVNQHDRWYYVKAQKNDDRDAEAIAETAARPTMRFVELKSQEQLDIQSLHRVRSRLVGARTNVINQLRAILLERGTTIAQGRRKFEQAIDALLADPGFMTDRRIRRLVAEMRTEWISLDHRIEALDREFIDLACDNEAAHRLASIPGIGALNATALVATVGDGTTFAKARDLGAWLGLVLLMDRAGWHTTAKLNVLRNITPIFLPSRAPELNPVENIWQYLRADWLSNRVFDTYEDIIDAACGAWQNLLAQPKSITSMGMRKWAHVGQTS
jgi:hypothetical protein